MALKWWKSNGCIWPPPTFSFVYKPIFVTFRISHPFSILHSLYVLSIGCNVYFSCLSSVSAGYSSTENNAMKWTNHQGKSNGKTGLFTDKWHYTLISRARAYTHTHHPNISMNYYHKIAIRIETISCILTHKRKHTLWSYSHICSTSHHGLSDLSRMAECTYFAIVEISCLHSPSGGGLWYTHFEPNACASRW